MVDPCDLFTHIIRVCFTVWVFCLYGVDMFSHICVLRKGTKNINDIFWRLLQSVLNTKPWLWFYNNTLLRPWRYMFSPMNCVIIDSFLISCEIRSFDRNFAEIPCGVAKRCMLTAKQWICLGKTRMYGMQDRIIQYIATDVIPIGQWYKVGCEKRLCSVPIFLPDTLSFHSM